MNPESNPSADKLITWDRAEELFPGCSVEWDISGGGVEGHEVVLHLSTSLRILWAWARPFTGTWQNDKWSFNGFMHGGGVWTLWPRIP